MVRQTDAPTEKPMPKISAKTRHPLAQAPLDELTAELARRKAALPKLLVRRDKLRAELEQVDSQIAMLQDIDGRTASNGNPRGPRQASSTKKAPRAGSTSKKSTLREKIAEVLGSNPMRPVEIAAALVDRGLHQGSKSLQVQVSTSLAKFDEFSKVARGQWIRKSGGDGD